MITLFFLWKVNPIISDDTFGAIVPMVRKGAVGATVASYYEDGADAIVPTVHMKSVLVALNSPSLY